MLFCSTRQPPFTLPLNIALNNYAFHWTYPEILAEETGLFKRNGIEVHWSDVTPPKLTNKTELYTDLLRDRKTDIYHAGEWACINRVARGEDAWIVAKSPPGRGTLNSTFAIFVRSDSGIRKPSDLAGKSVAIESGTGSYYTALEDLERHVPRALINLVQVGEPHKRLLALQRGEVAAASLVGPWPAIGKAFGLSLLVSTNRTNPTTIVTRKDMDEDLLRRFLSATNKAIGLINQSPERFKASYFSRVRIILEEMPPDYILQEKRIKTALKVPRWKTWGRYSKQEFLKTTAWMRERGVLTKETDANAAVATYPPSVYT
jgi:ABC-type nitrate/sulfonate/bicarbonate transport system substrate-binding protein